MVIHLQSALKNYYQKSEERSTTSAHRRAGIRSSQSHPALPGNPLELLKMKERSLAFWYSQSHVKTLTRTLAPVKHDQSAASHGGHFVLPRSPEGRGVCVCVCVCERADVSCAKTVTSTLGEQTPDRAVVMEMPPGPSDGTSQGQWDVSWGNEGEILGGCIWTTPHQPAVLSATLGQWSAVVACGEFWVCWHTFQFKHFSKPRVLPVDHQTSGSEWFPMQIVPNEIDN